MLRTYKVRFFRLASYRDGERLSDRETSALIGDALTQTNSLPQVSLISELHHQIRDIRRIKGKRVDGCFARLKPDAPHVVSAQTGQESQIPLKPGDKILDKSYFLYYEEASLLVYQMNKDGGSITRFVEYLNRLLPSSDVVCREDIIRPGFFEKVETHPIKWFDVTFVKPRNVQNVDPSDWTDSTISGLSGVNAERIKIRVSAPRQETLGAKAKKTITRMFEHGDPVGLKVQLEDIEEPIDLFSEVVQSSIEVTLTDGYPNPKSVVAALGDAYSNSKALLQDAIGDAQHLP